MNGTKEAEDRLIPPVFFCFSPNLTGRSRSQTAGHTDRQRDLPIIRVGLMVEDRKRAITQY